MGLPRGSQVSYALRAEIYEGEKVHMMEDPLTNEGERQPAHIQGSRWLRGGEG